MPKTIRTPSREEMLERLRRVSTMPELESGLYARFLLIADKEMTPESVVNMLFVSVTLFMRHAPGADPRLAEALGKMIEDYIKVLFDDVETRSLALAQYIRIIAQITKREERSKDEGHNWS